MNALVEPRLSTCKYPRYKTPHKNHNSFPSLIHYIFQMISDSLDILNHLWFNRYFGLLAFTLQRTPSGFFCLHLWRLASVDCPFAFGFRRSPSWRLLSGICSSVFGLPRLLVGICPPAFTLWPLAPCVCPLAFDLWYSPWLSWLLWSSCDRPAIVLWSYCDRLAIVLRLSSYDRPTIVPGSSSNDCTDCWCCVWDTPSSSNFCI